MAQCSSIGIHADCPPNQRQDSAFTHVAFCGVHATALKKRISAAIPASKIRYHRSRPGQACLRRRSRPDRGCPGRGRPRDRGLHRRLRRSGVTGRRQSDGCLVLRQRVSVKVCA
ncbi:hypothetical protein EZZ81_15895 [Pseudomonas viridiflava]|uniref:Uncharacterized protein n=1 Tax=Pseudomonas viridiflava TaxID=33069 RepID=A0AA46VZF5_PSEVI|nr:hypothetical protein EZZ81_15895 [Pseudomonas viridiflava]